MGGVLAPLQGPPRGRTRTPTLQTCRLGPLSTQNSQGKFPGALGIPGTTQDNSDPAPGVPGSRPGNYDAARFDRRNAFHRRGSDRVNPDPGNCAWDPGFLSGKTPLPPENPVSPSDARTHAHTQHTHTTLTTRRHAVVRPRERVVARQAAAGAPSPQPGRGRDRPPMGRARVWAHAAPEAGVQPAGGRRCGCVPT
jgi:hypothetical protein